MLSRLKKWQLTVVPGLVALLLGSCGGDIDPTPSNFTGLKVELRVGSALGDFCEEAISRFNTINPKLKDGTPFRAFCKAEGSGDVVTGMVNLASRLKAGAMKADDPAFPTLLSVDGEIYHAQLIYQMNQLFAGQDYIPAITDAPLLASSPMVLMAQQDLANGLRKLDSPFKALARVNTHKDLDPKSPPIPIHFVQTAPTRSNSGLQTLVAQFAAVSGKRPENLTVTDVTRYQAQVQQLQRKVTRYGVSTSSLAKAMAKNGPYWASVGSVYESSVIAVNSAATDSFQPRYEAIYPGATFSSNMRVILPVAPWVSGPEKEAAEQIVAYLRTPEIQQIAAGRGLRPGVPGVALGDKFTQAQGVNPNPRYDSYRPPKPEVVVAMLNSWQSYAKKPSLVVVVIDSSGSMQGSKIAAVQSTLQAYIDNLGSKEQVALIDFDHNVRDPVLIDGSEQGKARGLQFVASLGAEGGTHLYDAALYARDWLRQHRRADAINAVLVLTDGEDQGSRVSLDDLAAELKKSSFTSDDRIAFFTVGYGEDNEIDPDALKKIAELNGGYYSKGDPRTINRLMGDLQVEF